MQTNTTLIFFIILFTYLNKNSFSLNVIYFPFHYSFYNEQTSFESNSTITFYNKNNLYISMRIGTPPINLPLLLDDQDSGFILKECPDLPKSNYSISKSSSFKFDKGLLYQYINYELKTTLNNTRDKIYLNLVNEEYLNSYSYGKILEKNLKEIEIDEFNFLYLPTKEEIKKIKYYNDKKENDLDIDKNKNKESLIFSPKCGYIGLLPKGLNRELIYEKINFFHQLKNNNNIDNYYWYINYNNNKGELIIGGPPHMINPEKFSEDNLYMTHAKLVGDNFLWQIELSSIDIEDINSNKKYNLGNGKSILSINDNFIHCPKNYFDNITYIFFQKYLDNKICKKDTIKKYNSIYSYIFCYKEYFIKEDLLNFPILSLKSNELNYIFKLNYNDLFLKIGQIYIFKIIYNLNIDYWKLGKIFLEKYQFVFNYDTKMFGVYHIINDKIVDNDKEEKINNMNKNDKEKLETNRDKYKYFKILIILLLVILTIIILVYLLRKVIFSKKINSKNIEGYKEFGEEDLTIIK